MFKSALDYAAVAYHDKINKKELNKISRLQKNKHTLDFQSKTYGSHSPVIQNGRYNPSQAHL